jgi:3-deoxy-D-manno-octulosonic-acid transferase
MYFTYTVILTVGFILSFPYYLVRFRNYAPTLADRFGFLKLPQLRGSIWVHAVSVGEVKAVEKLLERLREQFPGKPIVVSTATPAGQQLARDRHDIVDHTFYFPIDLPWCVQRTLDRVNPELMIIAETEIWPNFLRACRSRGIRVVMINGRISDKSFSRYRLVRHWLSRVLESYTVIGMQSELDGERIRAIGANPQKVTVFGNLKYDVVPRVSAVDTALSNLLGEWKQVWIAASTMPGEEEMVLEAFRKIFPEHPQLKLVIAPRHPERFDTVELTVKSTGLNVVRRTGLGSGSLESASVLLLDSIGELAALFHYATVVFVGGSLVARGGHNILEPARHGKPVVFGPHMENFRDITRLFLDAKAAVQIDRPDQLAAAVTELITNQQKARDIGKKALAVVEQNTGATDRVLQVLEPVGASR